MTSPHDGLYRYVRGTREDDQHPGRRQRVEFERVEEEEESGGQECLHGVGFDEPCQWCAAEDVYFNEDAADAVPRAIARERE